MFIKNTFSTLSSFQKLVFFLFLLVAGFIFSTLLSIILLFPVFGSHTLTLLSSLNDLNNPSVVKAMIIMQITAQAGMFVIPAFLMAILCSADPAGYLGLKGKAPTVYGLLIIILVFVSLPFISWTAEINSHLKLPGIMAGIEQWMQSSEESAGNIMEAFMKNTSIAALLVNILMIAILPAMGEELVFRGIIQKHLVEWTGSKHLGIIIAALTFAAIHLQFYGFLPRFLLGLGFGYIYVWTGNLWLPILAHFINNIISVLVEFMARKGWISAGADEFGKTGNPFLILAGFLLVAAIMFYFQKQSKFAEKTERNEAAS
jgi:uncharacterized protein